MQFLALPCCTIRVNFLIYGRIWRNTVALPHIGAINKLIPKPVRWLGACPGLFRAVGGALVPRAASPPTVNKLKWVP